MEKRIKGMRMEKQLEDKIAGLAKKEGRTFSNMCITILNKYFESNH